MSVRINKAIKDHDESVMYSSQFIDDLWDTGFLGFYKWYTGKCLF